jgi:transposase
LSFTPFSTLKDGFSRFDSCHFQTLFKEVLAKTNLFKVPNFEEIGLFQVIDGSLFPTLLQMNWTTYRENKNAFKLHLSFNLNKMIPTEFWLKEGNSSERNFFINVLAQGVTYIADRGYFSFELAQKVLEKKAFFILRLKENMIYQIENNLIVSNENMPDCFKNISDSIISFQNDTYLNKFRLVYFRVWDSHFYILTNRLDLSTLNIITLYAFRWQIELFFKLFKRTLNGIHLMNHSENGLQIHFYLMMTWAILELNFKQTCQALQNVNTFFSVLGKQKKEVIRKNISPSSWIKNIAEMLYPFWKISKNWLILLKNSITKIPDEYLFKCFATF